MKTVTIFSVLLFFSVLLSGCVRDDMTPQTGGAGRVLTVNYSFDTPQTRVIATGAECEVKDVAIFFYNADDNNPTNETYVDCQTVTISAGNTSGSFPLPLPTTIVPGSKYKLIIIGNYNRYAPEGKSVADYAAHYNIRTYSVMRKEIQGELSKPGTRVTNPLPFWGRLQGADGSETTLTGPAAMGQLTGVSVRFSRAVARFDVANLAADQLKIAWVKVCNYRNKGYFFHETLLPGEIVRGTSATAPQGSPYPPGIIGVPAPSGPAGSLQQKLDGGGLYAFPNTVSYTSQDDKVTTCLMIAGYFKEKGAADYSSKLTYYRANVSENGSSQVLHRNYVYTLVINNVKKAGADTEEGAMNEKEQLLDYEVGDDWESEQGGTVTDGSGNFLTLSRTSVVLGSAKDESALIKVAVKKGTAWTVNLTNNADNAFRIERVNDESFSILTNMANTEIFTRKAVCTVSVTGIDPPLSLPVNVTQLSSVTEPAILVVEGKTGNFDYTVPGQGGDVSLQVITGSSSCRWVAVADGDLFGWIVNPQPTAGGNKGFINFNLRANTGAAERTGKLTVTRILSDGGTPDPDVAPAVITFRQAKSPYRVSLEPNYTNEVWIEGFQNSTGNPNGVAGYLRFVVLLADPTNYTFSATSSFNMNSDAFLTVDRENTAVQAGPLQTSKWAPSTVTGVAGQSIYLNVYRTGPGDKDILGYIVVTAVPNPGTGLPQDTYTVNFRIHTSCITGLSWINGKLWADRNVGASPLSGTAPMGLNYSYKTNNDDNHNTGFKGAYYNYIEASGKCASFGTEIGYPAPWNTGWRVPNKGDVDVLLNRICISKERAFIISDDGSAGAIGTWIPALNDGEYLNSRYIRSYITSYVEYESYPNPNVWKWGRWWYVSTSDLTNGHKPRWYSVYKSSPDVSQSLGKGDPGYIRCIHD